MPERRLFVVVLEYWIMREYHFVAYLFIYLFVLLVFFLNEERTRENAIVCLQLNLCEKVSLGFAAKWQGS